MQEALKLHRGLMGGAVLPRGPLALGLWSGGEKIFEAQPAFRREAEAGRQARKRCPHLGFVGPSIAAHAPQPQVRSLFRIFIEIMTAREHNRSIPYFWHALGVILRALVDPEKGYQGSICAGRLTFHCVSQEPGI